jgi:F-type H+-transporting ATPase subunit delta
LAKDARAYARRYARALQETIIESWGETAAEKAKTEMEELLVLTKDEVGDFFSNPVFGPEEKTKVLETLLKKHKVGEGVGRFLVLVGSLGHLHLLPEIVKAYDEAERERKKEIRARVRTAMPLDKKESARLAEALGKATGKAVLMDVEVDADLIGGVVAEVGSVTYDASIAGYLNRLQQEY